MPNDNRSDRTCTITIRDASEAKMAYWALKNDEREYLPRTEEARERLIRQIEEVYED